MSTDDIEEYFELMATKLKEIRHTPALPRFVRFNIEEVLKGLRHNLNMTSYCLLLEAPEGVIDDNQADQFWDNQVVSYMVLRQVELNDFAAERATVAEARKIGVKILTRILSDERFGEVNLAEDPVEYEKVGPVFNNAFGYRISFTAKDPISLAYKSSDWDA
ncbi:hypothetical protein [Hymenobacter sp. BT190]|uniref:hypothetical protein n=1 Tax=Hymenobacter sp. BT190 TaxID=2763505 RepID=UPI0016518D59|nr:hypothetical protein [Hymenobacter sp. BT190]MBC6698089.1 hypothetical protein [Hymenobacter sp. BT190]